ncbi:4-hydroxyphenylacetate 3-hydroxylase family protein [Actinosynnema sp. CA-248983]
MTMTEGAAETLAATNDIRPMTGQEYLDSLRDGREVYVYGERVDDVTKHPAFRNSARSVAQLYDALHAPEAQGVLSVPTDTGNGGFTHPFFKAPRSVDDLVRSRDAIAAWQRMVYGWMGRTPDYQAAYFGTLIANSDFYGPFKDNALRWYRESQERVLYFNHALVHPPIDRSKPADEIADVCVHVERETDAGLIVSGAKVVATGSALTNANFIAHYGLPVKDKKFGLVFTVPMDAPGLKLISRTSYEMTAAVMGSPFDYPLSSRLDENDAIMVFDSVLVPWENVFVYDSDIANIFMNASGFAERFTFHGCTRLAVKLDFIAGCVMKAVELTGTSGFRGVQAQVGEILSWRDLFWGMSDAMAKSPEQWLGGMVQPNVNYGFAYRIFMGMGYPRVKEIIQQTLGSGLIYLNSHANDWRNPDVRPYLDRYLRGSNGGLAVDRVKLMKLLWDAVGTEFGGRHELYERNYSGDNESIRVQTMLMYQATGRDEPLKAFAEQCMAEYDLDGWTRPDLFDGDDLRVVRGD